MNIILESMPNNKVLPQSFELELSKLEIQLHQKTPQQAQYAEKIAIV